MRRSVPGIVLALVLVLSGTGAAVGTPAGAAPPLPDSIASIGDSVSQAFDACCWYGDHPSLSWSTGWLPRDGITSHYERIRALSPAVAGRRWNLAVSGAKMAGGPAQARLAVAHQARYVTVLLAANDLCTSSAAAMTPAAAFAGQWWATLAVLRSGLPPGAHVFVSSIPDLHWLWEVLHTKRRARLAWRLGRICPSMLAQSNSPEQRQAVVERTHQYNHILADACAAWSACRFDGLATHRYQFAASQVSVLDYFHPDLEGQAELARVTWAASFWADLGT
ncbi:MAG TPA: GDSL-type esterase/lipase family protein [Actinomycetes bacterium]|nr:GDSL-type esterase/lipase family protein [Actinomycetes bacterium]